MCKNSIWDLINSTINRRDERDVQTAFFFFFFFPILYAPILYVPYYMHTSYETILLQRFRDMGHYFTSEAHKDLISVKYKT